MKYFRRYKILTLLPLAVFFQQCSQTTALKSGSEKPNSKYYKVEDFASVEKIDAHIHVQSYADTVFIKQGEVDNFRFLNLNVYKESGKPIEKQQEFSILIMKAFPGRIAWGTTFSLENFNDDGWQQEAIEYIRNSVAKGAIAVKFGRMLDFF